jgi:hypothetical protein
VITKEEFIQQNPFGTISKQNTDGSTTLLTQEEYDEFVENSRGIWDDKVTTVGNHEWHEGCCLHDYKE